MELLQRTLVTLVLLPLGVAAIYFGGWFYYLVIGAFLVLAAIEYIQLMHTGGYQPASVLVILGVFALVASRALGQFSYDPAILSLAILAGMAYHLYAFERGRDQATLDFFVTLGGIVYIGWIGAYLISIRQVDSGRAWTFIFMMSVWFADAGAYLIGVRLGRHKLVPRLSPKKTWEGYWGGVIAGGLGGLLGAYLSQLVAGGQAGSITLLRGLLAGLILALLTTLGDLGESMIKRQVGAKDSGKLLPGHGGAFDRIDSWLWAGVIGYYMISWLTRIG